MALVVTSLVVALVVTVLVAARVDRRTRRRVDEAVSRLSGTPVTGAGRTAAALARLDREVMATVDRDGVMDAAGVRMVHALSAIDDGIVLLDGDGLIVFTNESGERYLGARHGDALVGFAIESIGAAAISGEPTTRSVELYGPPKRDLVLSARRLDDGAPALGALVVIRDVTEHRRVDALRRDFVANISHELKTPMGGIGVLAETLQGELDAEDPDAAVIARFAQRMHHEALRASRTIDDLLELARIEAGDVGRRSVVEIDSVVAEAVARVESEASRRHIRIQVDSPAAPAVVAGDDRQLVSALANLVDNAVKYSPDGSTVSISTTVRAGWVDLAVADEGVGIPLPDQERIFERFYRVDRARSRDTGGTGLGLSIVRHVAVNHGGRVEVTSTEGEGATFDLLLPSSVGSATTESPTIPDREVSSDG